MQWIDRSTKAADRHLAHVGPFGLALYRSQTSHDGARGSWFLDVTHGPEGLAPRSWDIGAHFDLASAQIAALERVQPLVREHAKRAAEAESLLAVALADARIRGLASPTA